MKVFFRILLIFISLGIVVFSVLPPRDREPDSRKEDEVTAEENPGSQPSDSSLVRDLLGGSQIDAGNKAKDILNEVKKSQEEKLDEWE